MRREAGVSRKFLPPASAYRRFARDYQVDFSMESLIAQYNHESLGTKKPGESLNGYTLVKKWLDVTIAAMRADHADGLFTKHELSSGSCAFVRRAVSKFPARTFFGHGSEAS